MWFPSNRLKIDSRATYYCITYVCLRPLRLFHSSTIRLYSAYLSNQLPFSTLVPRLVTGPLFYLQIINLWVDNVSFVMKTGISEFRLFILYSFGLRLIMLVTGDMVQSGMVALFGSHHCTEVTPLCAYTCFSQVCRGFINETIYSEHYAAFTDFQPFQAPLSRQHLCTTVHGFSVSIVLSGCPNRLRGFIPRCWSKVFIFKQHCETERWLTSRTSLPNPMSVPVNRKI